eukprot:6454741-Amphidinium_carterae.1
MVAAEAKGKGKGKSKGRGKKRKSQAEPQAGVASTRPRVADPLPVDATMQPMLTAESLDRAAAETSTASDSRTPAPTQETQSVAPSAASNVRRRVTLSPRQKLISSAEKYIETLGLCQILDGWLCGREKHQAERVLEALKRHDAACAEAISLEAHLALVEIAMTVSADKIGGLPIPQRENSLHELRRHIPVGNEPPTFKYALISCHIKQNPFETDANFHAWLATVDPTVPAA